MLCVCVFVCGVVVCCVLEVDDSCQGGSVCCVIGFCWILYVMC